MNIIKPILKWAGGKEKELSVIREHLPKNIEKYIEPFVGGGSVFLNIGTDKSYINDKSDELILFYEFVKKQDRKFLINLNIILTSWEAISTFVDANNKSLIQLYKSEIEINNFLETNRKFFLEIISAELYESKSEFINQLEKNIKSKIQRTKKIAKEKGQITESDIILNMETALKSSFYMYLRYLYNSKNFKKNKSNFCAIFYFVREYCYASMFRYSRNGNFNVPYGGISYNRKNFTSKIEYIQSSVIKEKFKKVVIENTDFESFINSIELTESDFLFIDPPYDTEFSTYAQNKFTKEDQIRLANCLKSTKAKFMAVIKNTAFIYDLYKEFNIKRFEKKYLVSFKNRNNRDAEHLIIMNYEED